MTEMRKPKLREPWGLGLEKTMDKLQCSVVVLYPCYTLEPPGDL